MNKNFVRTITGLFIFSVTPLLARAVVVEEVYVGHHHHHHPVVVQAAPVAYVAAAPIVVQEAPPAELVEVVPASPGEGYEWIKGSWKWDGRWVWHKGIWMNRPHPGAYWNGGHWHRDHHGWTWREGHWR